MGFGMPAVSLKCVGCMDLYIQLVISHSTHSLCNQRENRPFKSARKCQKLQENLTENIEEVPSHQKQLVYSFNRLKRDADNFILIF